MRIVAFMRAAIAFACCITLSACSGCGGCTDEPEVEDPLAMNAVDEPEPEPEPEPQPKPDEDNEALRNALLGLDDPDAGVDTAAEPEPEPEPDPDPEPKPTRRRSGAKRTDASAAAGLVPPPPPVGLTDAQFNDALSDWRGVRTCLATEQVRGTGTRNGAVRVTFTIGSDGTVRDTQVVEASTAAARALAPCVERAAMRVQFPSFPGPDSVEKTAKFVF